MKKAFVFRRGRHGAASPKVGTRSDIGFFVRSAWEANMVRFYRKTGTCFIYEPCEFEFVGLKRGNRFYTPDFYLPKEGVYVELKGFLDKQSFTKLKRFLQYHPKEAAKLRIIIGRVRRKDKISLTKEAEALVKVGYRVNQLQSYVEIAKVFSFLPNWEH
jgi:hypothetical protein